MLTKIKIKRALFSCFESCSDRLVFFHCASVGQEGIRWKIQAQSPCFPRWFQYRDLQNFSSRSVNFRNAPWIHLFKLKQVETRCQKNIQSSVKGHLLSVGAGFFTQFPGSLLYCVSVCYLQPMMIVQAVGADLCYYHCIIIREYFCNGIHWYTHGVCDGNRKWVELFVQLESAIYSWFEHLHLRRH